MGRTDKTAREGGLSGEDGRDCEGREVVWGGRPRLRGREVFMGSRGETAREGGPSGEDCRDCEGSVGYLGRAVVKGGSVAWEGRFRLRGEGGLCG